MATPRTSQSTRFNLLIDSFCTGKSHTSRFSSLNASIDRDDRVLHTLLGRIRLKFCQTASANFMGMNR